MTALANMALAAFLAAGFMDLVLHKSVGETRSPLLLQTAVTSLRAGIDLGESQNTSSKRVISENPTWLILICGKLTHFPKPILGQINAKR